MTPDMIGEAGVLLAILAGYLFLLAVSGIIADYVLPHITFLQRWLDTLPDWDDEEG